MEVLISTQKNMETILLNNKIKLVNDFTFIDCEILVPSLNIQNLKQLTSCKIISKEAKKVDFNHNAGNLFTVKIRVRFDKIKQYLKHESCHDAINKSEYLNLLDKSFFYLSYHEQNLLTDKVALYAFGKCYTYTDGKKYNVVYRNKLGHKISLIKSEQNNFGQKRYINFKGQWYSNKNN